MNALSPRDGYRLWAPIYSSETPISQLEDGLVAAMTPPLTGLRLLDAGCGTGRRLCGTGAASAIGVDISPEMLEAGIAPTFDRLGVRTMIGDIRNLPLPDQSFDVVWCRLAIGHVPDCAPAYAELARAVGIGGHVIVSDFHPLAYRAGHRRTFRRDGAVHEVEHHVHELCEHLDGASAAGLVLLEVQEAVIGPDVRRFYEESGRLSLYEEHLGLPVVLALSFRRAA